MQSIRSKLTWLLLAAVVCLTGACVELEGQRLTLRYDPATDELHAILFYDGIHESTKGDYKSEMGSDQIPQFIHDGDVMLLGWYMHMEMERVREAASKKDSSPADKALADAVLADMKTEPIGFYRDEQGHIGAAQRITIAHFKAFLPKVNASVNETIEKENSLSGNDNPEDLFSHAQLQAAVRLNFQWLEIDGTTLRFNMPVTPSRWSRILAWVLYELTHEGNSAATQPTTQPNKTDDFDHATLKMPFLQLLSSTPMALIPAAEKVSLELRELDKPKTLRFNQVHEYNDKLEKVVAENIHTNLTEAMNDQLMGKMAADKAPLVAEVLAWGPPEVKVQVLLASLDGPDAAASATAAKTLAAVAKEWNQSHAVPVAPEPAESDKPGDYSKAWHKWCRVMMAFPLYGTE